MLSYKLLKNIKLKKKYSVFLKSILNRYVKKIHFKADRFYCKTVIEFSYPVLFFLKNHTISQFKVLSDMICFDTPGRKYRFSIIYNLLSMDLNYRFKVQIKLKEKLPIVSTIVPLYSAGG
jgi:NADH dehydrogenase (ubiquinone) Fe-S protein 3